MARKKKCPECKQKIATWMLTYSDMVTLLMVFFVMLMASGDAKIIKTRIILSAFNGKLGLLEGGQSFAPGDFENMGQKIEALPSAKRGKSLSKSKDKAVSIFKPETFNKKVRVTEDERGIVVSLMTDLLFEPNSAEIIIEEIQPVLENVRHLIDTADFSGNVRIEGHTDNMPYSGTKYKDNWELSTHRALAVLNALREIPSLTSFDETKVSVAGYGDTRPVENNDTIEGRELNRRVDIILLRDSL